MNTIPKIFKFIDCINAALFGKVEKDIILLKSEFTKTTKITSSDGNVITGITPLMYAIKRYKFNVVEILAKATKESNLNSQDSNGDTALHYAAKIKEEFPVYLLLQHGANPNIANNKDEVPKYDVESCKTPDNKVVWRNVYEIWTALKQHEMERLWELERGE